MATKKTKVSKEVESLIKDDEVTAAKNAARQAENEKVEAEKLAAAQAESDDQTEPVAVPTNLPDKQRKASWDAFCKAYEEQNPVKFAAKKKAGHFDTIPDSFTGRNELKKYGSLA